MHIVIALLAFTVAGAFLLLALPSQAQAVVGEGATAVAPADPSDTSWAVNPDRPEYSDNEVLVVFRGGLTALSAQKVVDKYGLTVQKVISVATRLSGQKIAILEATKQPAVKALAQLENDPAVAMASLNFKRGIFATSPNDPLFDQLWGLDNTGQTGGTDDADIDAPEAWDYGTGSSSVVVVDIDTGIDYTHEDLAANVWTNPGEIPGDGEDNDGNGYTDDIYGIDTVNYDVDPWDDHGHGTHTAGTIAAVGDNGIGVAGVGWSTKVMGLKFLDADGYGDDAGAIEAIYYAIDQKLNYGVNIVAINASWGGGGYNAILEQAIADAGDAGIIFVAAAGNDSVNTDSFVNYPSCFNVPTIVAVGATDHNDYPAWFTNYGAATVDLFAPGENILSTVPDSSYFPAPGDFLFDDMESVSGLWDVPTGTWAITEEYAYSGTHSWSDSPGGDYTDDSLTFLTTNPIDMTLAPAHAKLGFGLRYDLGEQYWDQLLVQFSADDGATWEPVQWIAGDSYGDWTWFTVPIPDWCYTGEFRVQFALDTYSYDGETNDGVYIDNVGIGATASSSYDSWSGTSMATPHVTGALALLASLYPTETAYELINRVRSTAEVLPQLDGLCQTEGRLNLADAADPDLLQAPWVLSMTPRTGVGPGTILAIEGLFFGDDTGTVYLVDGGDPVEAEILYWSDTYIEAVMPNTNNGIVVVENADGVRSTVAGPVSAWIYLQNSIMRRDGNAAVVSDDLVFSFGGYTQGGWLATDVVEVNMEGMWVSLSPLTMPDVRAYPAAVELDGTIYVCGGYDDRKYQAFDTLWAFDPGTMKWTTLAPMPTPLLFHNAVALDGKIWVCEGFDGWGNYDTELYAYDPATDSWETFDGPLATPRLAAGAATFDGKMYIFGGVNPDTGDYLTSVEVYDPASDSWAVASDLPIAMARMGTAVYNDKIYLVGGTNTDWWMGGTNAVLCYDPATDTWVDLSTSLQALPYDSVVHSSPAVGLPGVGILSINGMTGGLSSRRTALLGDEMLTLSISSVDPAYGPTAGGTVVTITGTGFSDVQDVTFDGESAAWFLVDSPTQITAESPAHVAGTVQVQVSTLLGSTTDEMTDDFTYVEAPTVTDIDPTAGPTAGGQTVVITGTDFIDVVGLYFGTAPVAEFTVDSDTQITATSPAYASEGTVEIEVTAVGGTSTYLAPYEYEYIDAPTVTNVDPDSGPPAGGGEVTITGTDFEGATDVTFGGVPATTFFVDSDTQITATVPQHVSGTVQVQVTATGGSSADTADDDYTYEILYTVLRGADRYVTAIQTSQAMFPGPLPAGSGLVLAPGTTFQEALCGGPLAAAYGGPVLLTQPTGLNPLVRAEIIRLQPKYVICIGLSNTIKNAVQAALGATGTASVIRGTSVYEMSYKVAKALATKVGGLAGATGIVTRGDNFPDAISVSPLACSEKWPVLLTGPTTTLSVWARMSFTELHITQAIKVGTYAGLPAAVTSRANLSGADRYATNVNVAEWARINAGSTFTHLGMATGDKFPDALAAGPYLAMDDGILLLTPLAGPVPPVVAAEITANRWDVEHVSFAGMLDSVMAQVKALLP
jgi:subtilisin family serine protease